MLSLIKNVCILRGLHPNYGHSYSEYLVEEVNRIMYFNIVHRIFNICIVVFTIRSISYNIHYIYTWTLNKLSTIVDQIMHIPTASLTICFFWEPPWISWTSCTSRLSSLPEPIFIADSTSLGGQGLAQIFLGLFSWTCKCLIFPSYILSLDRNWTLYHTVAKFKELYVCIGWGLEDIKFCFLY